MAKIPQLSVLACSLLQNHHNESYRNDLFGPKTFATIIKKNLTQKKNPS